MADIHLSKVPSGTNQAIACTPDSRFVFDFSTDEATMTRSGDNLVFTFDDGGSVELTGFYTTYNSEEMPDFEVDGTTISGADFFTAMNEPDLMPAAGPAAGAQQGGARYHEYANSSLMDGIDHLNGLDVGWTDSGVESLYDGAVGGRGGESEAWMGEPVNNPVIITPENPGELPPDIPNSGNMDLLRDVLLVKEEDLRGGDDAVASGAMKINAPDGVASIVIGGVTVWENGALTATPEIPTDEGMLTVTGFNPATGRLEYSYTLPEAVTHNAQGHDNIFHNFTVTVTDVDGDSASSKIAVVIQDDMPEITNLTQDPGKDISYKTPVLDFTNNQGEPTSSIEAFKNLGWDNATSSRPDAHPDTVHVGYIGGYKIIPTFVQYTFDNTGNFTADNLVDWDQRIWDDSKTGVHDKSFGNVNDVLWHKVLQLTPEGLSIGEKYGFGDGAAKEDGRYDINTNSHQGNFSQEGTPHQSEAIVLETENNSVSYGLDIQLGRFDGNEKALICFYLTPRNSNDNDLVKMVEVKASDVADGKISVDVPDGFNKVIVAPVVGKDANGQVTDSDFTIKNISFTKPAWEHSGEVSMTAGADGLTDAGVTWNWSESGLNNATVQVVGTLGGGEYTVELVFDGTTVKAVLRGNADADINLDGNTLFEGKLNNATGEWTINQFYKFTMPDGKESSLNVKFSATDADDDTAASTLPVNLHLDQGLDRFDNVETGTWDPAWGSDASKDHAQDYLAGGGGNDLIFGRGGTDMLFGDGGNEVLSGLKEHLLGVESTYGAGNFVRFQEGILGGEINWTNGTINHETINSRDMILQKFNGLEAAIETGKTMGDDALFGGIDQDMLFGMGGDDYLDGGKAKDILSGGSGNDILVYDADDYVVHGGSGVDLLLGGKDTPNLDVLLNQGTGKDGKPIVAEVEVLLKTEDTAYVKNLGITSHKSLLEYGVKIEGNMLLLAAVWGEGVLKGNIWEYTCEVDGHKLTLQTTLPKEQIGVLPESATSADAVAGDQADAQAMAAASTDLSRDDSDSPDAAPAEEAPGALNEGLNILSALDATPEAHEQTAAMNVLRAAAADNHKGVSGGADAPAPAAATDENAGGGDLDAFLSQVEALDGDKDSALIFGASDDVIAGTEGRDFIYAGAGDDLIVYDPTDYLVQGGDGIDFLLSGNDVELHLQDLLDNKNPDDKPMVSDVEVLLKGDAIDGLTSLGDLRSYGITVEGNRLNLSKDWIGTDGKYTYSADGKQFTLETTLTGTKQTDGSTSFMQDSSLDSAQEEAIRAAANMQADTGIF